MLIILKQLFVLYAFLFLGWLFGRLKKGLAEHTGILSFLLVNLFLPSKVFGTFSANFTTDYITKNYVTIIISVAILLGLVGVSLVISKFLTRDGYQRNVYRYTLTISNYAYMGYVLTEQVFGTTGLTDLILFCIPFAMYTYTFGYAMLTGGGGSLRRLLTPLTFSIALGIVVGLTGLPIPDAVGQVLSMSSACVGPISMVLTGLTLSTFALKELVNDKITYVVVAMRLLLIPAAVWGACTLLRLDSVVMPATVMASMPSGLNTIVFPKLVGKDCRIGARLALISHLFSLATLPLWLSILM